MFLKLELAAYGIDEGDQVLVSYIKNEHDQLVIVEIKKI